MMVKRFPLLFVCRSKEQYERIKPTIENNRLDPYGLFIAAYPGSNFYNIIYLSNSLYDLSYRVEQW